MNQSEVYKQGLHRAFKLSVDIEAQLTVRTKSEPLLVVVATAKEAAVDALAALVSANPEDAVTIRKLQNEVRRYDDIVLWLHQMFLDGHDAERELSEIQMNEAAAAVLGDASPEAPNQEAHDD